MKRLLIAIIGSGELASRIAENLSLLHDLLWMKQADKIQSVRTYLKVDAILSCMDVSDQSAELRIQKVALARGIPFLRSYLYLDRAFVGPWVLPNQPGCVQCVDRRIRTIHPNKRIWSSVQAAASQAYCDSDMPWSIPFLDTVVQLIVGEIRCLANEEALFFIRHVYVGYDLTLLGKKHYFLPDPLCPICSPIPDDAPDLAMIELQPRMKSDPRTYRIHHPLLTIDNLRHQYSDWRMGLISRIYRNHFTTKWLPFVIADMPLFDEVNQEVGVGRTFRFIDSEMTAVLEALERYAGMHPRNRRTVLRGSYRQLEKWAIDPQSMTLHHPEQRKEAGFMYHEYTPDLDVNWRWVYSWKQKKPVIIPEQMIYYRILRDSKRPVNRYVYETSNGCAVGGSLEEAIYYALTEVIERDAFLIAWYAQLPLTRLDLTEVKERSILMLADQIEAMGYEIYVFDMTMDSGLPSVWAMILNRAEHAPVASYSAAGAHDDPEKAILSALVEVTTSLLIYENRMYEQREKASEMVVDASKVQIMDDHVLLYSHPDTLQRFAFLFTENSQTKSVREVYREWYESTPPLNLTEELEQRMERILLHNPDVLIIDETTPEMDELGLKAVKVIVQGMLTMSFGHQYRRIHLERIQKVLLAMGHRNDPIQFEELNVYPHPFP